MGLSAPPLYGEARRTARVVGAGTLLNYQRTAPRRAAEAGKLTPVIGSTDNCPPATVHRSYGIRYPKLKTGG